MRNLRYKFYIILFIIFLMISASFTSIILFTTSSNKDSIRNIYYDTLYDGTKKNIEVYVENVCSTINLEFNDKPSASSDEIENYISKLMTQIKELNGNFEVYIQKIMNYDDDDISVYNIYSSKYSKIADTYSYYDKSMPLSKIYYPSYKTLSVLQKSQVASDTEIFYDNKASASNKRTFYSRYIPNLNLIITACFFNSDLAEQSEEYIETLGIENQETVSLFLEIMIFAIIILFLFLCYIESLYYKKLEDKYLTEKIESDKKYKHLKLIAETDALTKCYNRKYLLEKMLPVFQNFLDGQLSSSLILFDIDNFKKVNDTYGHAAGDAVLSDVAKTVRSCVRKEDIFARWGGEEFIVFFKYTNVNSALMIAEKIRASIESLTVVTPEHNIKVTVSIGVSTFKKADSIPNDVIERADDSMYVSKNTGKNKVTLYSK